MTSFESLNPQEGNTPKYEQELFEIKRLYERRDMLKDRWSELFEENQELDFKYPTEVQFDQEHKFKSDRSFYDEIDQERYKEIKDGLDSIDAELAELEPEILEAQFETGTQALGEALEDDDFRVSLKYDSSTKKEDELSEMFEDKEWKLRFGKQRATVRSHFTKQFGGAFSRAALGDEFRERKYSNAHFIFTLDGREVEDRSPGVALNVEYSGLVGQEDRIESTPPMTTSMNHFPTLSEAQKTEAREKMQALALRLGVDFNQ